MTIRLNKVVADMLKLKTSTQEGISSAIKEMKKAQTRLRNFELLTKDLQFGKWYVGHVKDERASIERLEKQITRSKSRLVQIGKLISRLLDMKDS